MHTGIIKSFWTEMIMKYTLTSVTGHCFPPKRSPHPVYAVGTAFLPLLEALLDLTFWNYV
jgi:hypothetical protein